MGGAGGHRARQRSPSGLVNAHEKDGVSLGYQ